MQHFIRNFRREAPGTWICTSPATLELPQGRVQVTPGARFTLGTQFMNTDLARMLEAEYQRSQNPPASPA